MARKSCVDYRLVPPSDGQASIWPPLLHPVKTLLALAFLMLSGCAGCFPFFVPDNIPGQQERVGLVCKF